jgi:uncharacterized OB-fold protein
VSEGDPAPEETWRAHARRRELAYQVADDGSPVFRPRVGAGDRWEVSAGRGAVYATTTVRPRDGEPYDVSLIDLDEGFRMMARVVGLAPEEVRIGARVVLDWDGDVPVFRPEATA